MENQFYNSLFEIADKNMQQSGKSFTYPKAAFLYYKENDPYTADVLELMDITASNEEFLHYAYISLLNRPADDEAVKAWSNRFSLPAAEFRRLLTDAIILSEETKHTDKRISGYLSCAPSKNKGCFKLNLMQRLLIVYRKLPVSFKRIIRKITKADKI